MQVKILTFFYILVNEQIYDKSIDNYIFLEYSLNMLTANICSIQKKKLYEYIVKKINEYQIKK